MTAMVSVTQFSQKLGLSDFTNALFNHNVSCFEKAGLKSEECVCGQGNENICS